MVEPWRVAQLIVDRGPGHEGSRGSGYLTAPGRVLTAAHAVTRASSVRVRLDVDQDSQIDVPADTWWADPKGHNGTDLAVVTIQRLQLRGGRSSRRGSAGSVTPQRWARWMRSASPSSSSGTIQATRPSRECFVTLSRRPDILRSQRIADRAPWPSTCTTLRLPRERMEILRHGRDVGGSCMGRYRIVAVVAEHYASEGTGRLTGRRIDRAYEQLSASLLDRLAELLGLPATVTGLPDVVPAKQGQLVRSSYLAQVRDITLTRSSVGRTSWRPGLSLVVAPIRTLGGRLKRGRGKAPWRHGCHPSPGWPRCGSLFITGRLSGQADSSASSTRWSSNSMPSTRPVRGLPQWLGRIRAYG